MKKLLAILLAAIMLVALFAACGPKEPVVTEAPKTLEPDEGGTDVVTAAPTEKKLLAIIVPKSVGGTWFARSEMGGAQWAEDTGNESKMVGSNKSDVAVQVQSIQDALALNPDFISVVPLSPEACETVLGEAMKNGVIVTGQEAGSLKNCHYDVEAFNNGEYGAHWVSKAFTEGKFLDQNKGKWVCFVQFLTAPTHNLWAEGAKAWMKANKPNWEMVTGNQIEAPTTDIIYAKVKELLQKYPDITLMMGGNGGDPAAIGLTITELGLIGKVFVTGTGMPRTTEATLKSGAVQFCSFWDPYETQYVCNVVSTMVLDGKEVKTGDDMGRVGYNSVKVDGNIIMGSAWIDVTKDNWEKYNFI